MAQAASKISHFPESAGEDPAFAVVGAAPMADPMRELQRLMTQLQDAARDARARQLLAEQERDRLEESLRVQQREADESDELKRSLRAAHREKTKLNEENGRLGELLQATEERIGRAEKDRLQAINQRIDLEKALKDARRQNDEVMRVRDEAVQQRNSVVRQRDEARKEVQDSLAKTREKDRQLTEAQKLLVAAKNSVGSARKADAEIQKQFAALRQARDAAAANVLELKQQVSTLEDTIAALGYERETALKSVRQIEAEAADLRQQIEAGKTLGLQLDEANADNERLRGLLAEVRGDCETALAKAETSATEAADLRKWNAALAESRDKLALDLKDSRAERDALLLEHEAQVQATRAQFDAIIKERDRARERAAEREGEIEEMRTLIADARAAHHERTYAVRQAGETLTALSAAQKQIENLIHERDTLRQETDTTLAMQEADIEQLKALLAAAGERDHENAAANKERERERLMMVELRAQVETARLEIRELTASLAAARLHAIKPRSPAPQA